MKWHKKEGDLIRHGDTLCDIETEVSMLMYKIIFQTFIMIMNLTCVLFTKTNLKSSSHLVWIQMMSALAY